MRRWQHGCHNDGDWRAACQPRVSQTTTRGCPGRCAGRLGGWCPGSLDVPAHLPALSAAKPLASGELDLARVTGTDDCWHHNLTLRAGRGRRRQTTGRCWPLPVT
jgi:hypothetical protein